MRTIVTGMNGTVAPVVSRVLQLEGHEVIGWNRSEVPVDDEAAILKFLNENKPDWFFHIATGSPDWLLLIAKMCTQNQIKLLFTSSASVFSSHQRGPFKVPDIPQPDDEYGRYKLHCEKLVQKHNPTAIIARLAWQIADAPGSNNMMDYIQQQLRGNGRIEASRNWFPACAFLEDTAVSLYQLMHNFSGDIYHLDGNPGLSFYEIVNQLKRRHKAEWRIVPADVPVTNNRLLDERVSVKFISSRF